MISPDEVEYIAHLARLDIEADKLPEYSAVLSNILALVSQMSAADTSNVEPMAHPMQATQAQRPDQVTEQDFSKEIQAMAPELEANLFLVPQVIE